MVDQRPQNTAELLSTIDREWKELWEVVGRLTPEQVTTPLDGGWSPKDHLAHLAQWTRVLLDFRIDHRSPHEVMGLPVEMIERWNFDEMNAALLERDRARSMDAVTEELKAAYAELVKRLKSMPFEALTRQVEAGEGQPRLLERVLAYSAEHYAEHRGSIQATL
jgi:hypothetical protein